MAGFAELKRLGMLSRKQIDRLASNWGEPADSLACMAEVRVYDPLSRWECYIYAINPDDEDEVCCLINGFFVEVCEWRLSELSSCFNVAGYAPMVDMEYRPRRADELFKILMEKERYGRG